MASSSSGSVCFLPSCNKPRYRDATSGIQHDFCGRTHAAEYLRRQGQELVPPHGICHECKLDGCRETVFYDDDTGRVHDFCCLTHAEIAMANGTHPRTLKSEQLGSRLAPGMQCALQGCTARKYVDPDTGETRDYCGRSHAKLAAQRGHQPPPVDQLGGDPAHFGVTFKGRNSGFGEPDYTLSTLTNAHPKYADIKRQFSSSWVHPGPKPTVMRVFQVRNAHGMFERYEGYKRDLEARGRAVNEERRFHATGMTCTFGIEQSAPPCVDQSCAVCSICQTAFELRHAGGGALTSTFGYLRYGRGLYFARHASKSNDYARGTERTRSNGERYRVMFLCKVALGTPMHTRDERLEDTQINTLVMARGHGGAYDSVVGLTTADGGALNYEESVVYDESAAIPSYLIVYRL